MKTVGFVIAMAVLSPGVIVAQTSVAMRTADSTSEVRILRASQATSLPMPSLPADIPHENVEGVRESPMGLADFEAVALANNPALARASAEVRAARGNWVQVGLPPNPTGGYSASEIGNEGRAGQQGGFIGQEFVMGHKLRLNRSVASREVERAEREFEVARLRVVNDVRVGFYDVLVAQRRVELTNELLRIGDQGITAAEKLLAALEVPRTDLLQARILANSARILAQNARNTYLAAWQRLCAVIGTPGMPLALVDGSLDEGFIELTFADATARLLASSPELAAAQADVQRARWAIERARVEPVPNLDVQLLAQYDNATQNSIAGVQAGIPIPIWNRNQGGIVRAQGELAAADARLRQLLLSLEQQMATAFERYANARQQVETYRASILPDANESLKLISAGYDQGEFSYLYLLTAQRTFFETNLAYLDALRELREATVAVEGMLLRNSLDVQR